MNNPATELIKDIQSEMTHEKKTTRAMKCRFCVEGKKCKYCESCMADDANCEVKD